MSVASVQITAIIVVTGHIAVPQYKILSSTVSEESFDTEYDIRLNVRKV